MDNVTYFDMIAAQLEDGKRAHLSELERQLFNVGVPRVYPAPPVPTWRERLRWKRHAAARYCSTLWKALRGVELEEPREDY